MKSLKKARLLYCCLGLWVTTATSAQAKLTLSEFLVINVDGPIDKDGNLSPWVEIHNSADSIESLEDWYLTDDPDNLTKWRIPRKTIPARGHGLLHVSGKGFSSPLSTEVHANFTLSGSDDYIALVRPDGASIASAISNIPKQRRGISYGLTELGEPTYFERPTPGTPNGEPLAGFVSDTKFSIDRGFYDAPFQVEITTNTPNARIIYTLSGRRPSEGAMFTGPIEHLYSGPITIDKTTVLRAAAFKDGLGPSNIDTQTYLFIDDVIQQELMSRQITESAEYGAQMHQALTALPTLSLAVEDKQFVGNGSSNTNDIESQTSVEWLNSDETPGFQVDAGISRFGGYFTNFNKKSFRLYFRKRYGAATLKFPLFRGHESGSPPVEQFDSLDLRSGSHDMSERGAYLSNRFVDDTMLEMGGTAPHGRFIHVYLNGEYWGQYHLRERWNAAMFASYFGGPENDYDAINGNDNFTSDLKAYDGTLDYWDETERLAREGQPWTVLQGRVDIADYLDFMMCWSTGNSESEFQAVGSRSRRVPFKFYMKDADGWLELPPPSGRITNAGPGAFLSRLSSEGDPDFKMFFADRIHKHYFNDGALTDDANIARLQRRIDEVKTAFIAEAARWGFRSPASWQDYQDDLVENQFPGLAQRMIRRFTQGGFYPADMIAPRFNQHGGITADFVLVVSAGVLFNPQGGEILYTTDGSDPRLPGGAVSERAVIYDREGSGIPLNTTVTIKARSYEATQWSALNEATFRRGKRPQPGDLILTEIHYHPAAPSVSEIEAGFLDRSAFEFLELYNTTAQSIELSEVAVTKGVRFTFGPDQLPSNAIALIVRNRTAFEFRYGTQLPIAGEYADFKLSDRGETLQLSLSNGSVLYEITYDDKEPWPESADGDGSSLVLVDPQAPVDSNAPAQWRASITIGGTPGSLTETAPPFAIDQDHDGLAALLESALGSSDQDPTSGPNHFELRSDILNVNGNTAPYWIFESHRNPNRSDIALTLEISSDLRTWRPAENAFVLEESAPNKHKWRSNNPIDVTGSQTEHLRLRAQQR